MELDRSPEPKGGVFERPEHEWLRIAAMADPDWEALKGLARRPGFDWWYLRVTSMAHQLNGVAAWRFLDPGLDGLCPEWAREEAQGRLDHLAHVNREYWRQLCEFGALLDRLSIEYVAVGGPGQYAPLGIVHWPRHWEGCDLDVRVASEADLFRLAEAARGRITRRNLDTWDMRLPEGANIPLAVQIESESTPGEDWSHSRFPKRRIQILGGEIVAPHPVPYVVRMAENTPGAVLNDATRMPLWALARLKAWIDDPEWDWQAFANLLREFIEWAATSDSVSRRWELLIRNSSAYRILWTLRMADRVYGVLDGRTAEGLITPHPLLEPCPECMEPASDGPPGTEELHVLEWDRYPGDEAFLFDPAYDHGREARMAAGMWKPHPDYPLMRFLLDDKGRRVAIS